MEDTPEAMSDTVADSVADTVAATPGVMVVDMGDTQEVMVVVMEDTQEDMEVIMARERPSQGTEAMVDPMEDILTAEATPGAVYHTEATLEEATVLEDLMVEDMAEVTVTGDRKLFRNKSIERCQPDLTKV